MCNSKRETIDLPVWNFSEQNFKNFYNFGGGAAAPLDPPWLRQWSVQILEKSIVLMHYRVDKRNDITVL